MPTPSTDVDASLRATAAGLREMRFATFTAATAASAPTTATPPTASASAIPPVSHAPGSIFEMVTDWSVRISVRK